MADNQEEKQHSGRKFKIMISYKSGDKERTQRVLKMKKKLEDHEQILSVWMDKTNMASQAGEGLHERITQAIDECDIFLMCLSDGYETSEYCKKEAMYAKEKTTIIPLKHGSVQYRAGGWLKFFLKDDIYYHIGSDEDLEENFPNIMKEITKEQNPRNNQPDGPNGSAPAGPAATGAAPEGSALTVGFFTSGDTHQNSHGNSAGNNQPDGPNGSAPAGPAATGAAPEGSALTVGFSTSAGFLAPAGSQSMSSGLKHGTKKFKRGQDAVDAKTSDVDKDNTGFPKPDPNDMTLMAVADDIGVEWEQLATNLHFSTAEIGRLKMDYPHSSQTRTFNMLVRWRGRQYDHVNKRQVLRAALIRSRLHKVADTHLS